MNIVIKIKNLKNEHHNINITKHYKNEHYNKKVTKH